MLRLEIRTGAGADKLPVGAVIVNLTDVGGALGGPRRLLLYTPRAVAIVPGRYPPSQAPGPNQFVPSEEERRVNERRIDGEEEGVTVRPRNATVLAAETLRSAGNQDHGPAPRGEDRISLFWRVFGGTLLSIAALVVITVYQGFSSTLNDLRSEVAQINVARAELIKKDEFNNRLTSVWSGMKDVQTANMALTTAQERMGERTTLLEQQVKEGEQERKALQQELQQVRERLAALEGRQAAGSSRKPPHDAGSDAR
jgi:hypothetical protein